MPLSHELRKHLKVEVSRARRERAKRAARIDRQLPMLGKEVSHEMPGIMKEFRDLARRVNQIDGWSATVVERGSHAGRGYEVRHGEQVVCRLSGSPSVPWLALRRAEAELRRVGCPLPTTRTTPTKEEPVMPMPTAEDKQKSDRLRPFLTRAVRKAGGRDEFLRLAVDLAKEQGSPFSTAYQARKSLNGFLDHGKVLTGNLARFEVAAQAILNGAAPEPEVEQEPVAMEPEPEQEPAVEPEPTMPPSEPVEPTPLRELVSGLEEAESRLAAVRDTYLKARDDVLTYRLEIIELMQKEDDLK